jgi:hypothetical protein
MSYPKIGQARVELRTMKQEIGFVGAAKASAASTRSNRRCLSATTVGLDDEQKTKQQNPLFIRKRVPGQLDTWSILSSASKSVILATKISQATVHTSLDVSRTNKYVLWQNNILSELPT